MNEELIAPMKTAFQLITTLPKINIAKYTFPEAYQNATLNEKLYMVRFMIEDLTINWDEYVLIEEKYN